MKPLMLKGHQRALTQVKYNCEGDLIFSAAKDKQPCVWYSDNGERLGTYEGHNGAVWTLDVTYDTQNLVTGAGDNYCMLWDVETGKKLSEIQSPTTVRSVAFSYSGNLFYYTAAKQMKHMASLNVFDIRMSPTEPEVRIPLSGSALSATWSHLDDTIVAGIETGEIDQFDLRNSNERSNFAQAHKRAITDLQTSPDETLLISSSKDCTAKLFDSRTLEVFKTYKSERPVNSAAISPIKDHVVLGGGEEAMTVTQTAGAQGQFEAKFYHMVFEDEFARIKGHFGPINTLAFHPDGRSYCSGGEDGYVRTQVFDPEYYDFDFDH